MLLITKKEAEKIALAITSEGMHFKGQHLPKKNYFLFGKEVKVLDPDPFQFVVWIEYQNNNYVISNQLIKSGVRL